MLVLVLVCIIYQNDPQLSLINLITINWLSRDYLKSQTAKMGAKELVFGKMTRLRRHTLTTPPEMSITLKYDKFRYRV